MALYSVFLEVDDRGLCLAHVPALPGCALRAPTRGAALGQLPQAINDYLDWLRRSGEPAPPSTEPIQVEIAGEGEGYGPFDPGDATRLYPPDRQALTAEAMERAFRLMDYSRRELLALTMHLPHDLLDWEPFPGSFSIRRVLRHVGNAEEWYVSRLVPPETLPPEWEGDEQMPLFDFLEMERRTAILRLRQLTEAERSSLFYPGLWTDHPDEAWTARKALRRFLEHEREHTAQVREILAAHRRWLVANLAVERAGLLEQLLGLDELALTGVPVVGDWTVKDLLAHVAAWDRWEERTMRAMVAGQLPDLSACDDFDASNAAFVAPWRDRSLDEVLTEVHAARADWLTWLESLPEEEFYRPRSYDGHDWSFHTVPLCVQWEHDAEHAAQIGAWRKRTGVKGQGGPKGILSAVLDAARAELLAAAALVPADKQESHAVCGSWTLKDVLGHVADWERFAADGLLLMAAGQPPGVELVNDIDVWNLAHAQARQSQAWETVWADLYQARQALHDALVGMGEADLVRSFSFPWGPQGTPYQWVRVFITHDREHAEGLRLAQEEREPHL